MLTMPWVKRFTGGWQCHPQRRPLPYLALLLGFFGISLLPRPVHAINSSPVAPPENTVAARRKTSFLFSWQKDRRRIVVLMVFNDQDNHEQRALRLILDTGSTVSLIKESAVRGLTNLETRSDYTVTLGSQKLEKSVVAKSSSLGSFTFSNAWFMLTPDALLTDISAATSSVDGIVGMNVLSNFAVVIDFARSQITLYANGNLTERERQIEGFGEDASTISISPNDSGLFTLPMELSTSAGKQYPMILDTGSPYSFFLPEFFGSGVIGSSTLPTLEAHSVYGRTSLTPHAVDFAQTGSLRWSKPQVYAAPSIPGSTTKDTERGILGMDLLSQCRILLDFPAKHLYIKHSPGGSGE